MKNLIISVFKNVKYWIMLVIGFVVSSSVMYGQLADTPWPMFHNNIRHTGWTNTNVIGVQKNPVVKWSYTTGNFVFSSPAIASDGTIYVGSYDKKLYAITNGAVKWTYTTGSNVFSSPAIASDGTIYVGSLDKKLYALNPDGSLKWSYTTGGGVYSSPVIGSDGTIYVGSYDYKLYAINPYGSLKWSYTTGYSVVSSPAIGSDGSIYVGSEDGGVYAITNGTLKWSYTTGSAVSSSPTIGPDGTIYVGSLDKKLYAITNGTLKWSYTTGEYISYSSPAIGADGTIYVGSADSNIYAINPDGSLKWSYTTGGHIYSSPAIGDDGTIYVGSYDKKLYAITNGAVKWTYTTGSNVFSSPAIASDGTIYVGSRDNKLYAIKQNCEVLWTGETGYTTDGVKPNTNTTGSYFTFRVKYQDFQNEECITQQVWIDTNDNGSFEANEKFDLYAADSSDLNYKDGKIYTNRVQLYSRGDGKIKYKFYFTDKWGIKAIGEATNTNIVTVVLNDTTPPDAPVLISPANGEIINLTTTPEITFKWEAVSDAVSYEIKIDNKITNVGNQLSYTPTFKLSTGEHSWSVRAIDTVGNIGGWSSANIIKVEEMAMNTFRINKNPLLSSEVEKGERMEIEYGAEPGAEVEFDIFTVQFTDILEYFNQNIYTLF